MCGMFTLWLTLPLAWIIQFWLFPVVLLIYILRHTLCIYINHYAGRKFYEIGWAVFVFIYYKRSKIQNTNISFYNVCIVNNYVLEVLQCYRIFFFSKIVSWVNIKRRILLVNKLSVSNKLYFYMNDLFIYCRNYTTVNIMFINLLLSLKLLWIIIKVFFYGFIRVVM